VLDAVDELLDLVGAQDLAQLLDQRLQLQLD